MEKALQRPAAMQCVLAEWYKDALSEIGGSRERLKAKKAKKRD